MDMVVVVGKDAHSFLFRQRSSSSSSSHRRYTGFWVRYQPNYIMSAFRLCSANDVCGYQWHWKIVYFCRLGSPLSYRCGVGALKPVAHR